MKSENMINVSKIVFEIERRQITEEKHLQKFCPNSTNNLIQLKRIGQIKGNQSANGHQENYLLSVTPPKEKKTLLIFFKRTNSKKELMKKNTNKKYSKAIAFELQTVLTTKTLILRLLSNFYSWMRVVIENFKVRMLKSKSVDSGGRTSAVLKTLGSKTCP